MSGVCGLDRRVAADQMIWIVLLILLIAVFGIGALLEATLWALLIIAAVVLVMGLAFGRILGR